MCYVDKPKESCSTQNLDYKKESCQRIENSVTRMMIHYQLSLRCLLTLCYVVIVNVIS